MSEALKPHEVESDLARKIHEMLKERLDDLRSQNDQTLSMEDTARLRGGIAEVKRFINLVTLGSFTAGPPLATTTDDEEDQ